MEYHVISEIQFSSHQIKKNQMLSSLVKKTSQMWVSQKQKSIWWLQLRINSLEHRKLKKERVQIRATCDPCCGIFLASFEFPWKAFDILDHAIHSAPHNPDLLVEMGDKKLQNNDAVEADRYFSRAIQLDPNHGKAIQLRAKTRDLAIQNDNIKLAQLTAKRNLLR